MITTIERPARFKHDAFNKIACIREFRVLTKCSLKDANDVITSVKDGHVTTHEHTEVETNRAIRRQALDVLKGNGITIRISDQVAPDTLDSLHECIENELAVKNYKTVRLIATLIEEIEKCE